MRISFSYLDYPKLLIKPEERVRFVFLFVLLTLSPDWILPILFRQLPVRFWEIYPENSLGNILIGGLVSGIFVGTFQWIIIRKYIPTWHWIPATTAGMSVIITVLALGDNYFNYQLNKMSWGNYPQLSQFYSLFLIPFCLIILWILSTTFLTFSQWLVIRQYTQPCRWWIWLSLITVGFSLLVCSPWLLSQFLATFFWEKEIIINIIRLLPQINYFFVPRAVWITIQAIGFCLLHKKYYDQLEYISASDSLPAQEITNYWQIYQLKRKISQQIDQTWKNDLNVDFNLTYSLDVNQFGSVIAYHFFDQLSRENLELTPLLNMIETTNNHERVEQKLAYFKVTFSPPASFQVQSLTGIPLSVLAIITIVLITMLLPLLK